MIMNTALPEYQGRMQGMAGAVQMSLMAIAPTMGGTIWNYTVKQPWPVSPHAVCESTAPDLPSGQPVLISQSCQTIRPILDWSSSRSLSTPARSQLFVCCMSLCFEGPLPFV